MPDKKYLIEIPGMPEGSGVWDADKWERNKDAFMADYPEANVFELGNYDPNDSKETDQIMLSFEGDEDSSGIWDNAKWERNKEAFMQDYPEAMVNRVRYVDYWGNKAEENRARRAELEQPDQERINRLAEMGYYDDISGAQIPLDINGPNALNLKPLSSAIEENKMTGETKYLDPKVQEFFVNDTATTERMAEIARLDDEYESNPSVVAHKEWLEEKRAADAAYAAELEQKIKADMESVDMAKASRGASAKHQFGGAYEADQMGYLLDKIAGDKAGSGASENEKLERYNSALKLLKNASDARAAVGKGFGGGSADTAKQWIRDAATQDDIEMYNEIGDILSRLEAKVGNLNEVTDEQIEANLTPDEQALIRAFFEYNSAMAEVGNDLSTWYKGGKIFAESVPFMIEFLATGGLYSGAGKAATRGLMKWVTNAAKGTAKRAARKAVAKATKGAVSALVGTTARTIASPGTYDRMAEASVEIDKEGHLNRAKNATRAFADMYIENLSEISGDLVGKYLGILGKGLGSVAKGTGKVIDKGASWAFGKTPFETLGKFLGDNRTMQQLTKAWGAWKPKLKALGFHGLPEEIGEEFIGNAIRDVANIQPGALKEMVEDDNFSSMLIGFAPMTLIGAVGGVAQIGVINHQAANLGQQIRDTFLNMFDNEQLDYMMNGAKNAKSSEEIWQAIKPFVVSVMNAESYGQLSAEEAKEKIEMLYQYGGFMAQNNALLFAKKEQDKQLANAKREQFANMYGRFWQQNESEDVQIATLKDGRTVFVIDTPAEDGKIAVINAATGRTGFANVADIATEEKDGQTMQKSNTMTMDAFLDLQIANERKSAEEVRMSNERMAQIEALSKEVVPGKTEINVGTEGSPILMLATNVNRNGVKVIGQDGVEHTLSWEKAADYLGKPIIVKTDKQIADEYVAARAAELAERRKARNASPATEIATQETAQQTAEVAEAENVHIPMNEDGTVNEEAFWEQNPEEYVKWNDEQNKDGGQDSLQQIAIAKAELTKQLGDAQNAQATSNPTARKQAKAEAERLADKILRLDAIEQTYAEALAQETEAIKETQATPTATMSEEDLVKMDEQYQGILGKTRVQSERVRVMQEYLDKLAENSVPVVLLTRQNYEKRMQEEGADEYLIDIVREQVNAGEQVAGFMAAGKVYLMEDGLNSIDDARVTYVHERQHTFNRANPELVKRVANALGSTENALAIIKSFVGAKALRAYETLTIEGLADEIIAFSMEKAYTTEEFSVDLQSRGIPSEVISIITEINDEQRKNQSLSQARRRGKLHSYADESRAGSVRQDGRNLEQISGGVLEQQTARPSETSERGDALRESAEVAAQNEELPFRIVGKPEDPNGVTAEQNDEINRSVGGELEIGDENTPVRFSITAIGHGAGLELLKDDGEGNVALVLPDGRKFNAKHLLKPEDIKSLPDSVLSYMMSDARALGNIDARKEWMLWNKYTLMLNAILSKGSAENGGFEHLASQWQWIADTVYKTVATNSDTQYSYSIDITRVCKKNEAVINAIAEMQARLGYGITPGQIMDIYMSTIEEGYQVPCPVCYVFSRYIRNGKYATIMINGQRKYGSKLVDPRTLSEKEKEKLVKYWLKELKKIQDQNEANENEINKANSDITVLLDEIDKLSKQITDPRSNLTEEQKETILKKIHELDARYKAALNVVSQSSLDSWITQFAIYKKKEDGKERWVLYEDSYMGFPEEMALDLRQTSTVMRLYPAIQRFRKSRGAAAGKEITFVSNNDLGDVALALGSKNATEDLATPRDMSDKEWEELQKKENGALMAGQKNLYQQAYEEKDANKKAELLKKARERFASASEYAKRQSLRGGQRMWSWSDNIERLAPDVFVNLFQMELLGGALQSYSKQLEGIKLVASMNGYVNGSLMGKGNGYAEVSEENVEEVDGKYFLKGGDFVMTLKNGKKSTLRTPVYKHTDGKFYILEFDDVVGIDAFGKDIDGKHYKGLFELNAEYDKAGNILVGMNDLHIRIAMADDRIFFIIPWHSSGANTHILAQMYDYLGVEYDVTLSQDYTDVQSEKRIKGAGEKEESSKKGKEKKESTPVSTFLAEFWNDHYENAREYEGYGMVAGKDFTCGIEGGIASSDGKGNLSEDQMHYRELRDAIFMGVKVQTGTDKKGKPVYKNVNVEEYSEQWFNEIMNDEFLSQVYARVRESMGENGRMASQDTKSIYPYEYWDESSTYATSSINGARYIEYCRRLGYKPKFCGKLDGKPETDFGNFTEDAGYWKTLIDRRMYAVDGSFQGLTPVTAENFTPDLVDPEVTKEEFVVTRVADEAGTQTIVDKAIAKEESRPGGIAKVDYDMTLDQALKAYNNGDVRMRVSTPTGAIDLVEEARKAQAKHDAKAKKGKKSDVSFRITPEQDKAYMDAVKAGDMETAQRMVDEAARAAGYNSPKLYHGTRRFGFTKIDVTKSDDGISFFTTNNPWIAKTYSAESGERRISDVPSKEQIRALAAYYYEEGQDYLLEHTSNLAVWLNLESRGIDIEEFSTEVTDMVYDVVERVEEGNLSTLSAMGALLQGYDIILEKYYDKSKYSSIEEQINDDGGIWENRTEVIGAFGQYFDEINDPKTPGNYSFYANTWGMLEVDCHGSNWNNIKSSDLPYRADRYTNPWTTRKVARYAKDEGWYGVIFKNIVDLGGRAQIPEVEWRSTIYNFFRPEMQVKSADPVTYDDQGNVIPLSERFNPENDDIRFRFTPRTDEQREQLFDKAKAHYGLTNNFNASGYMLPDGSLLDFSEANDGGDPNRRSLDHRDIEGLIMDEGKEYNSRYHYVVDFVDEGAIRMLPEAAGFQLSVPPTTEQRSKLMDYIYKHNGEVIMEITDENGGPRVYMEYNKRTSPSRIFRDMDGFFNEGVVPGIPPLRFRVSNDNQAIFVSNAAKAVEGIKQEKATPEQWLKMIEKNGGLKAGEDKWMGLSDWLKASDKKTLTKQEVLDFINENMIVIEEQHYGDINEEKATMDEIANRIVDGRSLEELQEMIDENAESASRYDDEAEDEDFNLDEWLMDRMIEEFGDDFGEFYTIQDGYVGQVEQEWWDRDEGEVLEDENGVRQINEMRNRYTTYGLRNNREIALTIPTIASWGSDDYVHFGDAGEGRAVAWIRFGETWEQRPSPQISRKVLVIDEIQSNRHQEGREKGYRPKDFWSLRTKFLTAKTANDSLFRDMEDKYGEAFTEASTEEDFRKVMTESEFSQMLKVKEDYENASNAYLPYRNSVPDAPFDKNWHELAMKRMLRYAAENGYDVIAWTKGDQQNQRYDLSNVVENIISSKHENGNVSVGIAMGGGGHINFNVDHNGKVLDNSDYSGRNLSDIVGKEIANKILTEESVVLSGDGLRIGGEGMRGFYDKILPAFMNKYGKKWGVKVEDIDLPNLENGLTMHSVPVTEEMKASVMEGQVMFRMRGENESAMDFTQSEVDAYYSKYNSLAETIVSQVNEEVAREHGYTLKELKKIYGVYESEKDRITIFAHEENYDGDKLETSLFHESIHKLAEFYPYLVKAGEWMYNNADRFKTFAEFKDIIVDEYEPEWHHEEMLCYVISACMNVGVVEEVMTLMPQEYKRNVEQILKEIGYDTTTEGGSRKARRSVSESAVSEDLRNAEGKGEGGRSSKEAKQDLTTNERRVINSYFPGAFRIVDSKGKELTPAQDEFFANSKAVDKDGNLLVLYHGTNRAGFTEFKSGWFTTSKEDAISYSGDRKGRMFDPNEKYEPETLVAGDFPLGYMTFDSEEDRAAFLAEYPDAETAMSEAEFDSMTLQADEEYDDLIARKPELQKIWNAYREYERERFVDTTIGELISNPGAYTEEDLMRAMLAYDSNANFDSLDDMDASERKDALVSALQNANEEAEGGILDMVVPTRVPRNGEGQKHNDLGNRTYEVYANVENPYEIDANGRGSEFESGDVYKAIEEALNNPEYDGVIVRNWRVGRTQQLGDVVVPKNGTQVKLTSNENPTDSSDIVDNVDENGVSFRVVTDQALLDQLNNEEYITLYRAMQIHDGGLYQPMAGKVAYKEDEAATWGDPTPEQTWLQSDETPWNAVHARYDKDTKNHKKGDLKYDKDGNPVWVFKLDKGNGKSLYANYNPYIHTSFSPLNDQFSEAQDRGNLVVVRVLVPKSELTSGYKAEKAHDAVGTMPWHSGPISGVLAQYEGKERVVMLTRYAKIDGIVPWTEVANEAMNLFKGTELLNNPLPTNVFMPGLREELEKRGVQFVETNNKGEIKEGPNKGKTWASVYGKDGLGKKPKDSEVRFRFSPATDEIDLKAMRGISTLRAFNVSFQEMRKIFFDIVEETEKTIKQLSEKENRTAYDDERLARAQKELEAAHRKIDWWESVNSQLVDTTPYEPNIKETDLDLEARTPAEYIAQFLTMQMTRVNKLSLDKKTGKTVLKKVNKRNGVMLTQETLKHELGWGPKDWAGFKFIISETEGKNLDEIAQMISEDSEAQLIFVGMGPMEIKDAVIDFLQSVSSYTEIRDYVKNERIREANELADYVNARKDAVVDQIETSTGMSVEEYNDRLVKEELKAIDKELKEVETSKIYGKFETLTSAENEAYQQSLLEGAETGVQEGDQVLPDYGDGALDTESSNNAESQGDSRGADSGNVGDRASESGRKGAPAIGRKAKGLVQEPMELSSESAPVDEVVNTGKQKAIKENIAAGDIYSEKIQKLNNSLAKLRSALAAQREYDVNTVKIITGLANELLQIGRLTDMSRGEIKRLLSVIKDATGKEDLSVAVERLMDIMIGNQLRSGKSKVGELMKVKASKVNASGVEVRGSLDVVGQQMMQSLKEGIAPTMTDEQLAENIATEENNLDSDSAVIRKNAENRLAGYYLARQYREDILASEAEEKALRKEIEKAKEQYDAGQMNKTAYKEFVKSCYDAIRENRMQRVTAYEEFANKLAAKLAGSIINAKSLNDAEKARVEQIHHFANSDMQGMPSVQQGSVKSAFWNNPILRFLFKPLATFDQMLRSFAPKSRNGEGYLWKHFMGGWLKATENEYKGVQSAHERLDEKVRSVFPEAKRWSDLFSIEKKMPKMQIKFWDGEKMADFELTQGNLLYIYMVNKMTDGQMKLRKMGITDADVADIARELDPRLLELADWIQDSFLPSLREKYNAVHEKLFGAPMSAIDNYFPIRVLANARTREVDLAVDESSAKPSTITGSIIKRTKNSLALDILGSDAFDVVLEHVEQMEKWAAFAEFNKDLNTLLSYNKFRNRVQNTKGIYGAGVTAWNNFRATAELAAGVYKPAVKSDSIDKMISNIAKGVTGAKISYRVYTALKQFLSAPAFVSDASPVELVKALANPYKAWKWAMENLPLFEKRWKSRQAGDSRLMETDADWQVWKSKIVELAGRYGMTPNAFVDALTVSMGAKAIYETKRAEYLKQGYSLEKAEEKAKRDATVLFNESQQSNEAAFLSTAQVDRTIASIVVTVFRNSSMGYQRMYVDALRNIKHMLKSGYKEESIEYMTKQMVRDGLTEEQAARAAERIYNRSFAKNAVRVATFGFLVQFAWNLGPYMAYLLMGDDDEEKKDMLIDAAVRGFVGGPVEGLAAGQAISSVLGDAIMGEKIDDPTLKLPAASDMEAVFSQLDKDPVRAINDIFNFVIQSGVGVNPQTITDAVVAIVDACNGDLETSKEVALAMMRVLQTPQSQIEKLYMENIDFTAEEALDMSIKEFAERYAKYKVTRNAPLTKWMYDDEREKELEDRYIKTFTKKAEEMQRTHGTEEAQTFFEYYDSEYEEMSETLRDLKKQVKSAIIDEDKEAEQVANKQLDDFLESEEFKTYEQLLPHIKAYEAFKKALKTAKPEERENLASEMIKERNAAVELLNSQKK